MSALLPFLLLLQVLSADVDEKMPAHSEEIFVVGERPFIAPVAPGQPVRIVFGVGELDVRAEPVSEVRAEVRVRCPKSREARCGKVRKRLRVTPKETPEGLEVRISGVNRYTLRRLDISGHIVVPEDSPLAVKAGIGDVDVATGDLGVTVRMGIGDLTVRAPEETVGSVRVRTRIGDASIRSGSSGYNPGKRKALIGAGLRWSGGEGSEQVDVRLRIGDARVILVSP